MPGDDHGGEQQLELPMTGGGLSPPKYVIDTSSLIAMREVYPCDVVPGAWDKLDALAASGALISCAAVLWDLERQHDDVHEWAATHEALFLPLTEEVQAKAAEILERYPALVDLKKRDRAEADPFLIAAALVNRCAVVTEEKGDRPPKVIVPDVCRVYRVECLPLLDMFRREGLRLVQAGSAGSHPPSG
jgi:hypothetical protein